MALGRREFSDTRIVLAGDSAIGVKADHKRYMESWDVAALDLIPGVAPTYFTIRQLTEPQKQARETVGPGRARHRFNVQCGLTKLEGYEIRRSDGSVTHPELKSDEMGKLGRVLTDACMCELKLPDNQLELLSTLIELFSEAQLPLSKPSDPRAGPPSQ